MTTTHATINWFAGDDWEIHATLLDENGNPYDLDSGEEIKWALTDCAGKRVLDETDAAILIVDAAAGTCLIRVASVITTTVPPCEYRDSIRIVIGGVTSMLSTGPVIVQADPWIVQPAVAANRPRLVS